MGKKISDADVVSEDGINKIADIVGALVPWVSPSFELFHILVSKVSIG